MFHDDKTRFSVFPCSEVLIFVMRSSTSEDVVEGDGFVVDVLALQKQRRMKKVEM